MRVLRLLAAALVLASMAITAPASARELTPIPVKKADRPNLVWTPAADRGWFGWTRYSDSTGSQNYLVQKGGKQPLQVNAKGTNGEGGGIYRHTLVYTQTRSDRLPPQFGDLYRFNLRTGRRAPLPNKVNTPQAEWGPSLSGRYLLFTRFATTKDEDVISKVMLYDRKSGALRMLAKALASNSEGSTSNYVVAGQVNGAYAVWERNSYPYSGPVSSNVVRFNIRRDIKETLPQPKHTAQSSPAVASDGTVYFVRTDKPDSTSEIVKKPVGAPAEVLYSQGGGDLYVDDRGKVNVVYFDQSGAHGKNGIYKLIDRM